MTRRYLAAIGITDPNEQEAWMKRLPKQEEEGSIGKIFDIGNVIFEKKMVDPSHPNYLSTKEVLEAIDAAGYRPATLIELLAYAKYHWKPAPEDQLTQEERDQRADASDISALGSPFLVFANIYRIPYLYYWSGSGRGLNVDPLVGDWHFTHRFLVFRK